MKYLIDWCINWIKSDCNAGRTPSYRRMEEEWTLQKQTNDPVFFKKKGISYANDALSLRWQQVLDYEKKGAADSITAGNPPMTTMMTTNWIRAPLTATRAAVAAQMQARDPSSRWRSCRRRWSTHTAAPTRPPPLPPPGQL
jgi:hypothetical protein